MSRTEDVQGLILAELADGPLRFDVLDNRLAPVVDDPLSVTVALARLKLNGQIDFPECDPEHVHHEHCVLKRGEQ